MVVVINLRDCKDWGKPGDVRIDRKTKWGNPFPTKNGSALERIRVIEAYEHHLLLSLSRGELDIRELIDAKRLGCWCKPEACHGDLLKELIEDLKGYYEARSLGQ